MQAEIVLQIDQDLMKRAEEFSRKAGKSLSQLITEYLQRLPEPPSRPAPLVKSLRGVLKGSELTEEDYRRHLEDKYL